MNNLLVVKNNGNDASYPKLCRNLIVIIDEGFVGDTIDFFVHVYDIIYIVCHEAIIVKLEPHNYENYLY